MLIQSFAWPTAARTVVAEALAGRGIEREDDVEIFRLVRRHRHQLAAGKKGKLLEQSFFVPNLHLFAQLLQGEAHRDLAPKRIAVRAHMAEDDKGVVLAQGCGDFRKARVR